MPYDMMVEARSKGNITRYLPGTKGEVFPLFDSVELRNGCVYGFKGDKPSNMEMVTLGPVHGNIKVLKITVDEVIIEIVE